MKRRGTVFALFAYAAIMIGIQLLATGTGHEYYLTQLIMTAYYTLVVLGLCLVMGYAGQISLGHGAFFALGGYTSAVLTTLDLNAQAATPLGRALLHIGVLMSRQSLYGEELTSISPWVAFVAAILLTVVVATLIGYPTLRLHGHYLAMGTLGFGLIVYRLLLGTNFTGSADGISSVPPWQLLPNLVISGSSAHRVPNYYVAWTLTGAALLVILNVVHSRTGRALRSIHGGERAANAMGVNTAAQKLRVFVLSAALAAVAGSFFTHYNAAIGPSEAGVMKSVRYVTLVAAGGMANIWGVLIIGSLLTFLSLRGCFGSFDHAVFGSILILIMTLTPEGPLAPLAAVVRSAWRRLRRRSEQIPGAADDSID